MSTSTKIPIINSPPHKYKGGVKETRRRIKPDGPVKAMAGQYPKPEKYKRLFNSQDVPTKMTSVVVKNDDPFNLEGKKTPFEELRDNFLINQGIQKQQDKLNEKTSKFKSYKSASENYTDDDTQLQSINKPVTNPQSSKNIEIPTLQYEKKKSRHSDRDNRDSDVKTFHVTKTSKSERSKSPTGVNEVSGGKKQKRTYKKRTYKKRSKFTYRR